jgi:rhamnopyranosyl-N-acetylglucosaminyl-diphospho-decaprenol beta-1,3/1,4-galactofuranosyltransferase
MDPKIAAVVVTYNRKLLLAQCLEAIAGQTCKPHTVFVVDNASTDGTRALLEERGWCDADAGGIRFRYLPLPENRGGAGGFFAGMEAVHESPEHFDGIWLMDDDGRAAKDCLERLLAHFPEYDYLSPLLMDIAKPSELAGPWQGMETREAMVARYGNDIPGYACPFNGVLFSRKVLDRIGYVIPEMFIWGDEVNYHLRAERAGFTPHTILDALYWHPSKAEYWRKPRGFLERHLPIIPPEKWKAWCMWRNTVFNGRMEWRAKTFAGFYLAQTWYCLFVKKSLSWLVLFNKAFFAGFRKVPDEGFRAYKT